MTRSTRGRRGNPETRRVMRSGAKARAAARREAAAAGLPVPEWAALRVCPDLVTCDWCGTSYGRSRPACPVCLQGQEP